MEVMERPGVIELARFVTEEVWPDRSAKAAERQNQASHTTQDIETQIER